MNLAPSPNEPSTSDPQQQPLNQFSVSIDQLNVPPNLPCEDLIKEGNRDEYMKIAYPLFEASSNGDWETAETIFQKYPWMVRYAITPSCDTALHIAAVVSCTKSIVEFVKHLVDIMEIKDMELQDRNSNTAFSVAVGEGNLEIAKIMLEKNKAIMNIPGAQKRMPLYRAVLHEREHTARYLFEMPNSLSGDYWNDESRGWVLMKSVQSDYFDIALKIIKDYPRLTSYKFLLGNLLQNLADKTYAYGENKPHIILEIIKSIFHVKVGQVGRQNDAVQLLKMIAESLSMMPRHDIDEIMQGRPLTICEGEIEKQTFPSRILFHAAKVSNTRFIVEVIRSSSHLVWNVDDQGLSIFHIAATHRHAETFSLLYEMGTEKEIISSIVDKDGNNMLHLVAKRATTEQNESGVAVQMHQELLWYKEVEKLIPYTYRQRRNKNGETPYEIFKRDHKFLVTEGAKWMKDTASQCMVVATLITTMVFAAAFTLPGGYDQNTGIPMFRKKASLIVFVVADAISLVFSSTSVLVFLSMLTSNYTERDVLIKLPKKLFFGLATLFLSVVSMMIAFSASFIVFYDKNLEWIPKMVICFAAMPVLLFAFLQFHILGDVSFPTFRSRSLLKPNNTKFY